MSRTLDEVSQHPKLKIDSDTHVTAGRHFQGKELLRGCRRIFHQVGTVVLGEVKFSVLLVLLPPSWPYGNEQGFASIIR